MGAGGHVAAAGGVEVEHFFQGGDAAVMHVRRGDFHVAQAGGAEGAHVFGLLGQFVDAPVGFGEGAGAADVVEAGVVERRVAQAAVGVDGLVVEAEAAVAVKAFGLFAKEQVHAACLGGREFRLALQVLVVAAVARQQRALEGGDGLDHMLP
ncbi:hypothetical protein SDC9_156809 [bioreactor metagenome]|uniref:Uncharacterized protein n=1 Tax=bioreactor metagenome TaxID=1076179 RepID=A0A645F584_9ZZZZ